MLFRIQTLVYQYSGGRDTPTLPGGSPRDRWVRASESSINLLFAEDQERRRRFLKFLRSGARGLFLSRGEQWISYGWCSPPEITQPPHLPKWARRLGVHWIFYCHTREEFRRQGHYRRLLSRLVDVARSRGDNPIILCDTLPDNFPSRAAVLRSGFLPRGVVNATHLRLPWLGGITVGGSWDPDQPHLPAMAASFEVERQKVAG